MEEIKRTTRGFFGIQSKLLLILAFVGFFFIAGAGMSLYGLYLIGKDSDAIINHGTPLVRSIQEGLSAMVEGQFAAERALDIDDPAKKQELLDAEETFRRSVARFNMFMAAITWGSESEAFARSAGGQNAKAWAEAGLRGILIVHEPSPEEIELAGQTGIYYGAFMNNTGRAIEARSAYLDARAKGDLKEAEKQRAASREYVGKARRFSDLTVSNLREMVRRSNETTFANATALSRTEKNVRSVTLLISFAGLIVAGLASVLFARRIIVTPLGKLVHAAESIGEGTLEARVDIRSKDEIGVLGSAFNHMAERLSLYTTHLEAEVSARTEELKGKVEELDKSNRLLTKREEELTLINERLRELDKAKSEFISVAAHQLRTPLSAIKWTLSLLIDENSANLTPEQRSLLMKGYESNERIINLINEMLVVTRIESGKVQYAFTPLHLEDLIESTLLDFAGQAHVRKMKLAFEKPKTSLPYVEADPEKLRGVIQNLVENAVRYTPDGGNVALAVVAENGNAKVSIRDSGIGIPARQQSSIFNKFFRADNAVKMQTDGSGLGLFVAKSIIEKHGGKIWFESAEGAGTTFYFSIPFSKRA